MQANAAPGPESIINVLQFGSPVDAERLVREFLQHEPASENGLILLGMCLTQQSRMAEAISVLRNLTLLVPESAVHWGNLGTALRRAGEVCEAEQAYRRAIELDPKFADALVDLGYLLLESGRYPEARDTFLAAHAADPASPEARIYAAKTCVALDDRELASRLIAPRHGWSELSDALTLELASLMTASGSADEGVQIYEEFLRRNPDSARAMANLVILYERINRLDDAQKLLQRLPPAESIDDPELQYDVNTA